MKQVPIKLGPVALLLTVISICLTVMAILTFSTAGADKTMAVMFADSTQIRYTLEQGGQEFLQQTDEVLAAGGQLADVPDAKAEAGGIEKVLEEEGYRLTIRLEPAGANDYTIRQWTLEKEWEESETIDGLWQGF
ncbi:MAG: hypothetical protein IJ109_10530 [Firmicutes bacterium]|nr:hypothetical protein [Bacillota bacterium]MBQ9016532.1 hypothetical protein [Bacillota bacterium]